MNGPDALTDEQRPGRSAETDLRPRRLSLSNWPVSARLVALVALASVAGLVLGGLRVADAISTSRAYGRTAQLAVLAEQATNLAQNLEDERDQYSGVAAYGLLTLDAKLDGASASVAGPIKADQARETKALQANAARTDSAASQTKALAAKIGTAFPTSVQNAAASVISMIESIPELRGLQGQPPSEVITEYSAAIANLFTLDDQIIVGNSDTQIADQVRSLGSLSRAKDEASQQRAFLYAALTETSVNDAGATRPYNNVGTQSVADAGGLSALSTARGLQQAYLDSFAAAATPDQSNAYQSVMASKQAENVYNIEERVTDNGDPRLVFEQVGDQTSLGLPQATVVPTWYSAMSGEVNGLRQIESQVMDSIVSRSQQIQNDATGSAILTAGVTAAAVLLVLLATVLVGRTLVRPLRRLRADALEIATERLPARVAAAAAGTEPGEALAPVEPVGVHSTDEIGQVARAFDRVHAEAVRLAGDEAQLRGSLSAMFISLSRRSVPLIDRMARMIDGMEQSEDDPDQLANLFGLDHLVTRMRRNSENLLVLAGEEPVRKWTDAVPLTDVTRAAVAEIQQYSRVAVTAQPEVTISGQAAADVVHLLAELIENATLFSPQQTPVLVTVTELTTGGVLVEVRDEGIGVSAGKLEEMNWRLDHPPALDVTISRHMGLYAVAHLAARHGIRIKLRPAVPRGLSALVWLPGTLARRERAASGQGRPAAETRPGGRSGASAVRSDSRTGPPARAGGGRHRSGLTPATGEQPVLLPARGSHEARPATAWFAAKRPSGDGAQPSEEVSAGWAAGAGAGWAGPGTAPGGYAPGSGSGFDSSPGDAFRTGPYTDARLGTPDPDPDPVALTGAGLPRRTPRTSSRPGSGTPGFGLPAQTAGVHGADVSDADAAGAGVPALAAPTSGLLAGRAPAPLAPPSYLAPHSGPYPSPGQPEPLPARPRSPEAVRSRLSGFQLGGRDAAHPGSGQSTAPSAEEENSR